MSSPTFETLIQQEISREVADQLPAIVSEQLKSLKPSATGNTQIDEETAAKIIEYERISRKPYLTRAEAAIYLDVSARSIGEWSARAEDDNRFPESNAGGEPRYKREKIDRWAEAENARLRLRRDNKR